MNEFEVKDKSQLVAAIKAASFPTFEEAAKNPVTITLGTAVYKFPQGVHERRAKALIREIHRTHHSAFKVAA